MTATSAAAGVSRRRHTDTAQLAGVALEAMACRAEGTRGEPLLPRIQRRQQQVTACPESTTASTGAAAGDRASAETTLQCMTGAMDGGYGSVVMP